MTDRLAELEEENAWLKSELGLQREAGWIARMVEREWFHFCSEKCDR